MKKEESRFCDLIASRGGVYSTVELSGLLGKSAVDVVDMARSRQFIGFEWGGEWVYLIEQFDGGELISGIRELLAEFPEDLDCSSIALFFLTRYENTGKTPIELLRIGKCFWSLQLAARIIYEHGSR